jgi:hypothetical protein
MRAVANDVFFTYMHWEFSLAKKTQNALLLRRAQLSL